MECEDGTAPKRRGFRLKRADATQRTSVADLRETELLLKLAEASSAEVEDEDESTETSEKMVTYKGQHFTKDVGQDEPWYKFYLTQIAQASAPFQPDEAEPYHFQSRERTQDQQELLNRQKLFAGFADPNDDNNLEGCTSTGTSSTDTTGDLDETNFVDDPNDELLKDLYDDLVDDDNKSVSGSFAETRSKAAKRSFHYERFYNLKEDPDYDNNLSVTHSRDELLTSVLNHRVTIVVGPTGTGKTTQIPLYILDACAMKGDYCNIMVTQPRRLAASTNAKRVVSLRRDWRGRPWKVGHLVGYHLGLQRMASRATSLIFCTTAIFLKIAASELNLNRFTHIFLDEVHERDQDTDLSLMLVKKMMQENSPDVKLIIMSATMNLEKIQSYFADDYHKLSTNVVKLSLGYSHDIQEYCLDDLCPSSKWPAFSYDEPQLHRAIFRQAVELIATFSDRPNDSAGAVLMFLPGMSDILEFNTSLSAESKLHSYNWDILSLHSQLNQENQNAVMKRPHHGVRRIILSTNIAESSVTIPYVVYVIDFGLTKRLIVDPVLDIPRLALQWTSKANMTQRKGRTGRVKEGVYFCMLPRDFHEGLPEHELPDITVSPIHQSILHVKVLNLPQTWKPHDLFSLLLDPPLKKKVDIGILQLKEAGALSLKMEGEICSDNGELTHIGRLLERLPVSINLGRLIVYAYAFGVLGDGITMAAGLSIHSIFLTSASSDNALRNWFEKRTRYNADAGCDCLCIARAWNLFILAEQSRESATDSGPQEQWCANQLLSFARMREMYSLRNELKMRLMKMGMFDEDSEEKLAALHTREDLIKIVIAAAFYPSYFVQEPIDSRVAAETVPYGDSQLTLEFSHLPGTEGPLYEDQLRNIAVPLNINTGARPDIIYTTDTINDKAYVTFNRHGLRHTYGVADGVHLALRSTRGFCSKPKLTLITPSTAYLDQVKRHITNWNLTGVIDSLFLARKNIRRTPIIPQACAVPIGRTNLRIVVENIFAADRLFIRFEDYTGRLSGLHNELQKLKHRQPPQLINISPGDCALAMDPKTKSIFRVEIISNLGPGMFGVFAVDFAKYFNVQENFIRTITPELAAMPAQAFEFRFAKLHIREILTAEVEHFLKSGVLQPTNSADFVHLEVFSVLGSVIRGTLSVNHIATGCTKISLNDELVRLGFASVAFESYLSLNSHQNPLGHLQYGPQKRYVDISGSLDYRTTAEAKPVHGPYSPIIAKFHSLVQQMRTCDVRCSLDSVNHRVLDGRPEMGETVQRIMVAASVERSEKTEGAVVLRNSTVLPRQPGLIAVLVTLFSPCVQLKTSKAISKEGYIGAIAGVGFAPSPDGKKTLSLYPEHDLRAQFDVVLTPSDVEAIDGLRFLINSLIKDINYKLASETQRAERAKLQQSCGNLLFNILTRPRKPCHDFSRRNYAASFTWSLKDKPFTSIGLSNCADVMLQPLYMADLENMNALLEKDRHHEGNVDLHRQAIRPFTDKGSGSALNDVVKLECSICKEFFDFRQNISVHIHTESHRQKEREMDF